MQREEETIYYRKRRAKRLNEREREGMRLEGIEHTSPADDLAVAAPRIASFCLASTRIADCKPFTIPVPKVRQSRSPIRDSHYATCERKKNNKRTRWSSGRTTKEQKDIDELITNYTGYRSRHLSSILEANRYINFPLISSHSKK